MGNCVGEESRKVKKYSNCQLFLMLANMKKLQKLPVTESGFEALRKQNMLYVDKTERMLELINKGSYLFLSRPRRFGKSLLINTLKALFENKKTLFEDLYIYDKWEWEEHGVIHLDFPKFCIIEELRILRIILSNYFKI
ncbi:MAG: AAA family ATPase [Saprospiraceae bacterium]|nr:AAA family ATPase [Saprospiraceae bacterium]